MPNERGLNEMNKPSLRRKENKIIREYIKRICLERDVEKASEKAAENLITKLTNVCGKTGGYYVPEELFQKRTARENRAIIFWKTVLANDITYEQLESFEGGIVVIFRNNDFFDDANKDNDLFLKLKKKLGSDELVSSAIFILNEEGNPSSAISQAAFDKLVNNTEVEYRGKKIVINESNYRDYFINKNCDGTGSLVGNDKWDGFLYIAIRGGSQSNKLESHKGKEMTLFNPACEYASKEVREDLTFVMEYYILLSFDENELKKCEESFQKRYSSLLVEMECALKESYYDIEEEYTGNLLDFVKSQYWISFIDKQLTDPIQMKPINASEFCISQRSEDCIDFTHQEAVECDKYHWDKAHKCLLSPARPTNVFWSYHLSNMMQQNYTLDEYFAKEKERFLAREKRIKEVKNND